jgi:hypothetical protein
MSEDFSPIPLKITKKYFKIHLTKEVKYKEDYKTLMKEIEGVLKKWKDTPCSRIYGISVVKMIKCNL